jgi:hypothetical protein
MKTSPPRTMKTTVPPVTWRPMPNPIKRQTELMGFETTTDYLLQMIANTVSGNEADTYINDKGELASGCEMDRGAVL